MNIYNKLDQYLYNNLSEEEKVQFERELLRNSELSETYQAYSKINRILENSLVSPVFDFKDDPMLKKLTLEQRLAIEEDYLRYNLNESNPDSFIASEIRLDETQDNKTNEEAFRRILKNAEENTPRTKTKFFNLYTGIAAALVVSLLAGKFVFDLPFAESKKISPQKAFLVYFKPQTDNELKAIAFSDNSTQNLDSEYKRSGINQKSNNSYQSNYTQDELELSYLFNGVIWMERNNMPEAKKYFNKILNLNNPKKLHSCLYYLSLACLSEGKLSEALPYLNQLSKSKNPYKKQSRKILNQLIVE